MIQNFTSSSAHRALTLLALVWFCGPACTLHHSRQALWSPTARTPSADATFVTEEDSGVALAGVLTITEPDHYAVLMERARKRYNCAHLHHAQLDFYTDHWLIIAFPIARLTVVCEQEPGSSKP